MPTEKHHQRKFLDGVRVFSAKNAEKSVLFCLSYSLLLRLSHLLDHKYGDGGEYHSPEAEDSKSDVHRRQRRERMDAELLADEPRLDYLSRDAHNAKQDKESHAARRISAEYEKYPPRNQEHSRAE